MAGDDSLYASAISKCLLWKRGLMQLSDLRWFLNCLWWTGRPDVLRFMVSQRVGHDWATELNWTEELARGCHSVPSSCPLLMSEASFIPLYVNKVLFHVSFKWSSLVSDPWSKSSSPEVMKPGVAHGSPGWNFSLLFYFLRLKLKRRI